MANYIQLLIKTPSEAELDLSQDMDIALQYSIADIKDITKRNSAYSKTIIVPGTKNNNYWFGNLFDINSDFTMFNPNKKVDARILVNTETVIDGFLQLKKIKKLVNTDAQGNMIQYEVVVYNNAVDLMTELGEKTLNELELSRFNHTYSNTSIKDSWNNTYKEGYVYPMYGTETKDSNYKASWFYPATFYRTALDEIIKEAGFGWKGSLKTNAQFNKEIIPYVSDGRPKINQIEIDSRLFYVGVTNSTAEYTIPDFVNNYSFQPFLTNYVIPFTNETTPYFDTNNHWDQTTSIWTVDKNGEYTASYNMSFDLILKNISTSTTITRTTTPGPSVKADFKLQYSTNNGVTWTVWNTASITKIFTQASIAPLGTASENFSVNNIAPTINFGIGTKVKLTTTLTRSNAIWWSVPPNNLTYPTITSKIKLSPTNGGNWLKNNSSSTELSEGDTIQLGQFLSEKIKQKDLITDLIKRYNLYIQTDPDNPRVLIFDTRPDFYSTGTTLDWTNKKDYSSEDQIELLSELQFKKMIFSYKQDNDEYNKEYQSGTGDVYGQYKYTFDNDFVKGEEKVESPFSPTPLVKTAFGAFVPGINPEKPKVNPRILYWGGLKNYGSDWSWTYQNITTGATTTETFTTYPYAGHFDDPLEPTLDINFGVCKYYWYNELENVTQNNMYNTYWSNYIRQIEEGRMVTSKFYLDEYDIRFIKDNFNTKIFVLDSYYYVNKITDYKPLNNSVTSVELIKVTEGVQWKPIGKKVITQKPIKNNNFSTGVNIGSGNVGNGGNVVIGSGNISGGVSTTKDNVTKSNTQMIIGDSNTVTGDNSIVSGNRNVVTTDNSAIIGGDGNTINTNNTILIGTTGITATEPGLIYLGNSLVINTITGAALVTSNYISASRNEVLNTFPDNKIINFLSASRNEVRELGSQDITNYVSGGRYTE